MIIEPREHLQTAQQRVQKSRVVVIVDADDHVSAHGEGQQENQEHYNEEDQIERGVAHHVHNQR